MQHLFLRQLLRQPAIFERRQVALHWFALVARYPPTLIGVLAPQMQRFGIFEQRSKDWNSPIKACFLLADAAVPPALHIGFGHVGNAAVAEVRLEVEPPGIGIAFLG